MRYDGHGDLERGGSYAFVGGVYGFACSYGESVGSCSCWYRKENVLRRPIGLGKLRWRKQFRPRIRFFVGNRCVCGRGVGWTLRKLPWNCWMVSWRWLPWSLSNFSCCVVLLFLGRNWRKRSNSMSCWEFFVLLRRWKNSPLVVVLVTRNVRVVLGPCLLVRTLPPTSPRRRRWSSCWSLCRRLPRARCWMYGCLVPLGSRWRSMVRMLPRKRPIWWIRIPFGNLVCVLLRQTFVIRTFRRWIGRFVRIR